MSRFLAFPYGDAIPYLERALAAPPRLGRPVADAGRRAMVEKALERARARAKAR